MSVIFWVLHHVVTKCSDSLGESSGWIRSRDSVVDIVTRLWAELSGVRSSVGTTFFSCLKRPDWLWGPPSLCQTSTGGSVAGDKADHSPPSSTKLDNVWNHTSFPLACLHGMERDNLQQITAWIMTVFFPLVSPELRIWIYTCSIHQRIYWFRLRFAAYDKEGADQERRRFENTGTFCL
jgi:hypothetical protein